jgi:hypothetical protein
MKYQVDRLAETLSGDRQAIPVQQEAAAIEQEWLLLEPLPAPLYQQLSKRIERAMKELEKA